jgi:ABC-type nitrate/sulfonate/bicarbonate transport system substrate-binding protein
VHRLSPLSILRTIVALLVAVLAWGWSSSLRAQGPATPITIAVSSNTLLYGGLFIAEKAGLFTQQGVAPKIVVMDSGNAAMTALISRSAQFAASGPGEVLTARSRGQKVVILGNFYRGFSASVVLARAIADKSAVAQGAPVTERLRALNGLIVAAPSATSAYLHPIKRASEETGARPRFVYMSQPAMVAALQSGAIQAMIGAPPYSSTAIARGLGVDWINGPRGDLPAHVQPPSSACLQTTEQYATANPAVITRMRAVLTSLARFVRDKPDDAKRLLQQVYPQLAPAALEQAFTQNAGNWTQPALSEADIAQEIRILSASGVVAGLDRIQPAAALWTK